MRDDVTQKLHEKYKRLLAAAQTSFAAAERHLQNNKNTRLEPENMHKM